MRGLKLGVVLAALAALIVTSIAVADEKQPVQFASLTGHFTATGKLTTTNCVAVANTQSGEPKNQAGSKGAGGSKGTPSMTTKVKLRRATFSGTSTSTDARLSGAMQIKLRVVLGDNGLGEATGSFRIGKVEGNIIAVVSDKTRLDGIVRVGRQLIANFSGTLTGSTLTADIGSGSHQNTAVANIGVAGDCAG